MKPNQTAQPSSADSGGLVPDPVVEEYKRHVDRTLLRENLKLTVEERFANLRQRQRFAVELRAAGRAASHG